MKTCWLKKSNKGKLLLFFSGWGMDPNPFRKIESNIYDVLLFYDYRNITGFDKSGIHEILEEYKSIDVLAWSMGVWAANYLMKEYINRFDTATALNGTLSPIDDNYGIPTKIFQLTIDNFSPVNRLQFNKRMCLDSKLFNQFENCKPLRDDDGLKEELIELKNIILNENIKENIFTKALISSNDKIIPVENQKKFWNEKIDYDILEGPHFMFYTWKLWEDIVNNAAKS